MKTTDDNRILSTLTTAPITVQQAAKVLFDAWNAGKFDAGADALVSEVHDHMLSGKRFPDADALIFTWLTALAQEGESDG